MDSFRINRSQGRSSVDFVRSIGFAESLEPRRLLSGGGLDIAQVEFNGRTVEAVAGEWIVSLDASPIGADKKARTHEQPVEPWLEQALAPLGILGIDFDSYLGLDTVFSVKVPVNLTHAALQTALGALPGFKAVEPNGIAYGSVAPNDPVHANQWHLENRSPVKVAAGGGVEVGDITLVEYNGDQVRAAAGEWVVALDPVTGGASGEQRTSEQPVQPWLAEALDAVTGTGVEFGEYIGRDFRFSIRTPVELSHTELSEALAALPGFRYVQPNLAYSAASAPTDPGFHGDPDAIEPNFGGARGEDIRVEWMGEMVNARAGEFNVMVEPTAGGAEGQWRSVEEGIEPWLNQALETVSDLGLEFDHYLGIDTMFSVRAPTSLPLATISAALAAAVPGFTTVEPNFVGQLFDALAHDPVRQESTQTISPTADAENNEDLRAYLARGFGTGADSGLIADTENLHDDLNLTDWRNGLDITGNGIGAPGTADIDENDATESVWSSIEVLL